jgi:hypothetical protein
MQRVCEALLSICRKQDKRKKKKKGEKGKDESEELKKNQ